MFINKKFILASSSRSRYKILKQNNLNFLKKKPTCNEESIKKKFFGAKKFLGPKTNRKISKIFKIQKKIRKKLKKN